MLLLKSFFNRNNIRNYIILFIILGFILLILQGYYLKYLDIVKEKSNNSYIAFATYDNFELKISNIEKLDKDIFLNFEKDNNLTLVYDNDLKNKDIILNISYKDRYNLNVGDKVILTWENLKCEFFIKDFKNQDYEEARISEYYYKLIEEELQVREYKIYLKNWLTKDKVIKKLEKINVDESFGIKVKDFSDISKEVQFIMTVLNLAIKLFKVIFLFIYFVLILNIFSDEQEFNYILNCIGYDDFKILLFNYIKLLLLILISNTLSITLFTIFGRLINLSFDVSLMIDLLKELLIICLGYSLYYVGRNKIAFRKHM